MKKSMLYFMLFILNHSLAQSQPIIRDYPLKAMNVVLNTFGTDSPIPIGTISDSGELDFKFPKDLNFISDATKANYMSDTAYTLFSKCDNSYDLLSEDKNVKAVNAGYISLNSKDNPYSGLIFMVTDKALVPWLEDTFSNNAIIGSYFELVYIESDFNYQGECTSTIANTEKDNIVTSYSYNIQLKAGFNFVEYKIENVAEYTIPSMYEENVFDKIIKPLKITVTSSQSIPSDIVWTGKYF